MLGPVLRSEMIAAQSASILLRQSMTISTTLTGYMLLRENNCMSILVTPRKIYTLFTSFVDLIHYRHWTWRHQFASGESLSQGRRLAVCWCLHRAGQNAKMFWMHHGMHRCITMAKGCLSRPIVLTQHRIWSARLSIRPCQMVRGCCILSVCLCFDRGYHGGLFWWGRVGLGVPISHFQNNLPQITRSLYFFLFIYFFFLNIPKLFLDKYLVFNIIVKYSEIESIPDTILVLLEKMNCLV